MKAIVYCRISGENDERTASLESQAEGATAFARNQGYEVVACYRERFSGANLHDRTELSEARARVRSGEVQAIVCHAIDRLSRDPVHLMILVEETERHGAKLLL